MDERNEAAAARRKALGLVIRALRGERTQTELGVFLGGLSQPAVSAWEKGQVDLTCEQVRGIEIALGVRPGTIGAASGFTDVEPSGSEEVGPSADDLVGSLRPIGDPELIEALMFPSVDQALEAVRAAHTLNLGVGLKNEVFDEGTDDERTWWWVHVWTAVPGPESEDDELGSALGPEIES